jgi:hypothetical protein
LKYAYDTILFFLNVSTSISTNGAYVKQMHGWVEDFWNNNGNFIMVGVIAITAFHCIC